MLRCRAFESNSIPSKSRPHLEASMILQAPRLLEGGWKRVQSLDLELRKVSEKKMCVLIVPIVMLADGIPHLAPKDTLNRDAASQKGWRNSGS